MKLIILVCGILLVLAIIGGPGYYSPRSIQQAWNLGHLFLFSLLTYILISLCGKISIKPFLEQLFWIFFIVMLLGLAIEVAQFVLGSGTPDLADVIRNFVGCLFTFVFLAPSRNTLPNRALRLLQGITILALLLEFFPLTKVLIDEKIAREQFPVLADFETHFESDRWTGDAKKSINHETARHGNSSLLIHLTTAQYSGVGLKYFPHDWQGYNSLQFSIFNPSFAPLKIVCRIHDSLHFKYGGKYEDRYNRSFIIKGGWNDIIIPLEDIANAPKNRQMEMSNIQGFGIFTVHLTTPQVINFDYLKLNKSK